MAKPKVTFESKVAEAKVKIHEKPRNALKEIGKVLVKAVRDATPRSREKRLVKNSSGELVEIKPGRLKKSVGYWYRKIEGDLQIGLKSFYAVFIENGTSDRPAYPFFLKAVEDNKDVIQELIQEALKELNKD